MLDWLFSPKKWKLRTEVSDSLRHLEVTTRDAVQKTIAHFSSDYQCYAPPSKDYEVVTHKRAVQLLVPLFLAGYKNKWQLQGWAQPRDRVHIALVIRGGSSGTEQGSIFIKIAPDAYAHLEYHLGWD